VKNPEDIVPIGIHGDGTPCGANEALEQLSFNFPAWQQDGQAPRFLICSLFKKFLVEKKSYHAMFEVIAWSFKMLSLQQWPTVRHDGSEWRDSDKTRSKQRGSLPACGALVQARGDWMFFKEVFSFPAWNAAQNMCWLCCASQATYRDASLEAPWRQHRTDTVAFFNQQREQGVQICPVFSLPLFTPSLVLPDWLHTVDQGVAADTLANTFLECMPFLPGNNKAEQTKSLWMRIRAWYQQGAVASRLDNLTYEMLKQDKKPPKLRGKAAQVRALVPFGKALADELCTGTPHLDTVRRCMGCLADLYACLEEPRWPSDRASELVREFALLYCALEQEQPAGSVYWRVKPKLHLAQELVEYIAPQQGCPRSFWTYRDEDWGGDLAKWAARRGGHRNAGLISLRLMQCFCGQDKLEEIEL
jgi:hypothetical protein